ncbi:hypothetical protein MWU49_09550 [Alcanivorax sp. S6407]|uniref:hypothetical protein n=1 Tax=Alcanivorax sp. S6407 TaxID=2926424 RepID=UPI001FF23C9D|nr:hypothetical protein [Alcanivorax sp. S6407]MCK0153947.1 hypothetical protein [Alcanivorax sp. S6407]
MALSDRYGSNIAGPGSDDSIKIAVSEECLDSDTSPDPFTNPYRNPKALNMKFCLPAVEGCNGGINTYMSIYVDKRDVNVKSWISIASSETPFEDRESVKVFTEKKTRSDGTIREKTYFVDNDEGFVSVCSGAPLKTSECLLVGFNEYYHISYQMTVHGSTSLKWNEVHAKVLSYIDNALARAKGFD